jgi:Protein of unknown function (DUF1116)
LKALKEEIDAANARAVKRILTAEAVMVDMKPAGKAISGFKPDLITHAGPPIPWSRMLKVQRLAVVNAARAEGLAQTSAKAESLIRRREILIESNHKYGNVSGMCGATSASCPVMVFRDKRYGNVATDWMQTDITSFAQTYEKGAAEMEFVKSTLGPVLSATIRHAKGFNMKDMLGQGLQMGDELHGRFDATRGVFSTWILPHIVRAGFDGETVGKVGDYLAGMGGRWIGGNMMMGACKVMMDSARGMKYSTVVTAMSRNGVEFGVKVSGLGDKWFTGPAGPIRGFIFPGFSDSDGAPDIGDSAISETRGLGGTALPASPSQARMFGGGLGEAVEHTKAMKRVSLAEDPFFRIPYMEFSGVPVGIDIRKVVDTGVVPRIDTGVAHKDGGFGIIGTGIADAPMEAFRKGLEAFGKEYL